MQVWFLGKADVQKVKGNPHLQKTNFGYDDERGDYQVVVSDHIAYRYEVQGVLGKGSFGQVLKVLDYKTGTYKALKVIRNKKRFHHQVRTHQGAWHTPARDLERAPCMSQARLQMGPVDCPCRSRQLQRSAASLAVCWSCAHAAPARPLVANNAVLTPFGTVTHPVWPPAHLLRCLQAQVELKVLQHLRHNDLEDMHHVIHIQEHFMFRNHLCITFELLSINLYEFIKQNNFQGLSLQLIKRFAQQMLVSLR